VAQKKNQIIIIIILKCGDFFRKRGILWQNISFFTFWKFHSPKRTLLVTLGVNLVVPTPTKVIRLSIMGTFFFFKRGRLVNFFFSQFYNVASSQEGFSIKWWQSKLVRKLVLKMLPKQKSEFKCDDFYFIFWNLQKKHTHTHKWKYFEYLLILQYA
jgi:hypothetical protein